MQWLYYAFSAFLALVGLGFVGMFLWAGWNEACAWWDRRHPGPGPLEVIRRNWLRHLVKVRDREIEQLRAENPTRRRRFQSRP